MDLAKFREVVRQAQEPQGYFFNVDEALVTELFEVLVANRERYGYMSCPCRLASGVRDKDRDIMCPCVYRAADVMEYGSSRPTATMAPEKRETLIATIEPSPTPTPSPAKAVVTNAGEFGLRIRETPGGNQIDFLQDGTVLEVIPEPQVKTDDGITWQKVRDPQGRVGWVSTEYIVMQ